MVRAREVTPVDPSGSGAAVRSGAELSRVIDSVPEPTTRVRGVAGTPELVLGTVRSKFTPGALSGLRTVRDAPEGVSVETASAPETARLLRTSRSVPELMGSTRLPAALLMAAEVTGLAERSTATLRTRASRDDAVMGVRSMRPPVRSTELKLVRVMLDCNSALRVDAAMLRGPMVSGPRMTRRGE